MPIVRKSAVAGRFYPGDPGELRSTIQRFLAATKPAAGGAPKAIIVPHAGYPFSGPIAAAAFASLKQVRGKIQRVILIGTGHWGPYRGLATSAAEVFETPLGLVPLDREAIKKILKLPQVVESEDAHQREHSLEVQIPFLQETLGEFRLVPLAVGESSPAEVAEVLETLWGGEETLIVLSSDLSHYHDYETARQMDQETARAIESFEKITEDQACGRHAINGLLEVGRKKNLRGRTVDLRSSGDTAGPREEVVGYGAFVFEERGGEKRQFSVAQRRMLIDFAIESLKHGLEHGCAARADSTRFPAELQENGAAFVTLFVDGELRGCIGSIRAHRRLIQDVAENACAAAFDDARFPSLEKEDLEKLEVHISILSELEPVHFSSEADLQNKMRVGVDGLVLEEDGAGGHRGTLLPSMWDELKTPVQFLGCLKRKAGLPPDYWSPSLRIWRFTTESF